MTTLVRAGLVALLVALASPATAQQRDLRQHDGSPIPGLVRQDLEGLAPDRLECRKMVDVIEQLATLLGAATRGDRLDEYRTFQERAPSEFRFARGECDRRIASVDAEWPRAVLDSEYDLVGRLWAALLAASTAFQAGEPPDEVNRQLEAYDAVLAEWVTWLQLSAGFWGGRYLEQRPDSCLSTARESVDGLRGRLHELGRIPSDRRVRDELEDIDRDIERQRADLVPCDDGAALTALEIRSLDRILDAFGDALNALRGGDDTAFHRALAREQEHVSRMVRCRQEHALGEVSPDCSW